MHPSRRAKLATSIATSTDTSITVRGRDLVNELIGHRTYTEMVYFLTTGRTPDATETRVLDACLVTLMEHGMTISAIVTRLIADNVPGEAQVAMAAGLLPIGSVFVGTMEGCARILHDGVTQAVEPEAYARDVVQRHMDRQEALPGFGHRLHKPDDPRALRLLAIGDELGLKGDHVRLLRALGAALDAKRGKHVTINATGAIAALLCEIRIPLEAMRAMAVVSRAGGLPGHLLEEKRTGSGRRIWRMVDDAIPYEPPE
ncbi:MAG TPA: citryl-CoA lyase [Falsiroseomonas sp.]|jgi:citrate synthase|nr:citryl-CoA lyase [Falsiroseomonas sp.]